MVFHLWAELTFQKTQNRDFLFLEVLNKVSDAYKNKNIINQKLNYKNLDLKQNSVLNQDLEPILEISLNYLDPIKGGYKGAPKFLLLIYLNASIFYNKSKTKISCSS